MSATQRSATVLRGTLVAALTLLVAVPTSVAFAAAPQQQQQQQEEKQEPAPPANPFLDLGTEDGIGGEDFMRFDRGLIKDQILQFIPPVLQPAFVGHAFVLPPGAFRIATSVRFTTVHGDDFFLDGESNLPTFKDFKVTRRFVDLDLFYGFDLNRKGLHGFTLRVNVPYQTSTTAGAIHPNGVPVISLMASGTAEGIGDISVFVKKRVLDQGNAPFGLAIAGAVRLPTGSNTERFGNNGLILASRPDPDGDGVQPSFTSVIEMLGGPQNFFNGAWQVPAAMLMNAPQVLTPFPFNGGVFGRFSADGRMATPLQPGTGAFGATVGAFITRQFEPGDFRGLGRFPGRSALHAGILHTFNKAQDGIDPGDKTTFFVSLVKPIMRDAVALDFTFVGFHQQNDSYAGRIPEPEIRMNPDTGVAMFSFDLVDRPGFTGGTTLMVAPSLIVSPDPQLRFTATALFRIKSPDLGPAPDAVLRLGSSFTF